MRTFRLRRSALALFSLAGISLCPVSTALANGRFPRAERLVEDPRDSNALMLAATYGLVTTQDRGASWYHICEASFAGSDSYMGDPLVDLAADGALLVDVQTTLNLSRDQGCSWSTVLGGSTENIADFTVVRQPPSGVLALRIVLDDGGVAVHLTESTDDGATFQVVGSALPVFTAFTIDVAPSAVGTIYVTGRTASGVNQLLVSTDHGTSWKAQDLPVSAFDEVPYIAAVHPTDPKKIFVRTDAWNYQNGFYVAGDALLYSDDGGQTWTELYRAGAKLFGFALSPDTSTVLIGYGDPRDPERQVDDSVTGVYQSATTAFAFNRVLDGSITCLSWTNTGVYVCTDPAERGYSVGFSPDSNFGVDASGLEPLLTLANIAGPQCCGGAMESVCAASWSTTCALFGACRDGGGSNPLTCSSDGGTDGTTAGADDLAETGPGLDGGREGGSQGGCGCRAHGSSPGADGAFFGGVLMWCVSWLARRRRPCVDAPPLTGRPPDASSGG